MTVFWRLPRSYLIIIIFSTFRLDHLNFLQSRCNINPRSSWWCTIASLIMFRSFLNWMTFFIIIIRKIFAWQILLLRSRILIFNQLLSSHLGFFVIGYALFVAFEIISLALHHQPSQFNIPLSSLDFFKTILTLRLLLKDLSLSLFQSYCIYFALF